MRERVTSSNEDGNEDKVRINQSRLEDVILLAVKAYQNREGVFRQEVVPPEKDFIDIIKRHETLNGLEGFAVNGLFFFIMNLFADNSTQQLRRAADPRYFEKYAWLFIPGEVLKRSEREVLQAAQAYITPGLNKGALLDWRHNAQVLVEKHEGSIKNFFSEHDNDAPAILDALMGPKRKKGYGGLRRFGQKLGLLLLIWVDEWGLVPLKRINELGIPVDFQVMRIMVQTGAVELPRGSVHKHHVVSKLVPVLTEACRKIDREKGIPPAVVSKSLWFIGHLCCNKYDHDYCPIANECRSLISRSVLDDKGLVDPQDVGRWRTNKGVLAEKRVKREIKAGQRELWPPATE